MSSFGGDFAGGFAGGFSNVITPFLRQRSAQKHAIARAKLDADLASRNTLADRLITEAIKSGVDLSNPEVRKEFENILGPEGANILGQALPPGGIGAGSPETQFQHLPRTDQDPQSGMMHLPHSDQGPQPGIIHPTNPPQPADNRPESIAAARASQGPARVLPVEQPAQGGGGLFNRISRRRREEIQRARDIQERETAVKERGAATAERGAAARERAAEGTFAAGQAAQRREDIRAAEEVRKAKSASVFEGIIQRATGGAGVGIPQTGAPVPTAPPVGAGTVTAPPDIGAAIAPTAPVPAALRGAQTPDQLEQQAFDPLTTADALGIPQDRLVPPGQEGTLVTHQVVTDPNNPLGLPVGLEIKGDTDGKFSFTLKTPKQERSPEEETAARMMGVNPFELQQPDVERKINILGNEVKAQRAGTVQGRKTTARIKAEQATAFASRDDVIALGARYGMTQDDLKALHKIPLDQQTLNEIAATNQSLKGDIQILSDLIEKGVKAPTALRALEFGLGRAETFVGSKTKDPDIKRYENTIIRLGRTMAGMLNKGTMTDLDVQQMFDIIPHPAEPAHTQLVGLADLANFLHEKVGNKLLVRGFTVDEVNKQLVTPIPPRLMNILEGKSDVGPGAGAGDRARAAATAARLRGGSGAAQ